MSYLNRKTKTDYQQMITQARRLEDAADICEGAASTLSRKTADLLRNWQGQAAEAMNAKLADMLNENNAIARELREKAAWLRRRVREIQEADGD